TVKNRQATGGSSKAGRAVRRQRYIMQGSVSTGGVQERIQKKQISGVSATAATAGRYHKRGNRHRRRQAQSRDLAGPGRRYRTIIHILLQGIHEISEDIGKRLC